MKKNVLLSALLAATLLFLGCSSKPDDALVEKSVRESVKTFVPGRWINSGSSGPDPEISSV